MTDEPNGPEPSRHGMMLEGRRIRLISTSDVHVRLEPGTVGTITFVDSNETLHVRWDNGIKLGMIPGVDSYEILPEEPPAEQPTETLLTSADTDANTTTDTIAAEDFPETASHALADQQDPGSGRPTAPRAMPRGVDDSSRGGPAL